ncbi:MAG: PilT/PilU family type 4a pilus ATPase [Candidatus Gracilibacteria bacterium]|nr:PilT/PilU family type 4a pilus ATPase [Candidatus Gracilibacteria bacterium]
MEASKFLLLVDDVIKNDISDLHITPQDYPYIRNAIGEIVPVEAFGKLNDEDIATICTIFLGRPFTERTLDVSYERTGTRFRVNISQVLKGVCISMRTIPSVIPKPEDILLTKELLNLTQVEKGIILVTGPTGSGKTTTMAAMIEHINQTSSRHIITLEDPVEFVYENKKSLIHQRELGKQFDSFAEGIRGILREDPDVIVVGEMRDLATIETAITLAETGHLVFSTLHTNDTIQTIDRIIQSFPAASQNQIRMQLGLALTGVISQMLLPRADQSGRVVAREIMLNNDSVRNLIIRGETQHMYSILEISKKDGMMLMDDAILTHYRNGLVSRHTIEGFIRDRDRINLLNEENI